jgi:hypothetical protein
MRTPYFLLTKSKLICLRYTIRKEYSYALVGEVDCGFLLRMKLGRYSLSTTQTHYQDTALDSGNMPP